MRGTEITRLINMADKRDDIDPEAAKQNVETQS